MNQIKCPHCGEVFTVNQSSYAEILSQVRNETFNKEINDKLEQLKELQKKDIEHEQMRLKKQLDDEVSKKNMEIIELKQKINAFDQTKVLELMNLEKRLKEELTHKDKEVQVLETKLQVMEKESKLEIQNELSKKEKSLTELENKLELERKQAELERQSLKENYQIQIKLKEEEIERYKDFKLKQSTKMLGETLEQHCEIEFNRMRMTAFPNAVFEKDNDTRSGSKGDYIYREFDDQGIEIISIMFEMKTKVMKQPLRKRMKPSLKNLIRIEMRKNVNMQFWYHFWNLKMNYTM